MRLYQVVFALPLLLFTSSIYTLPVTNSTDIASLIQSGLIDPQIFDHTFVHFECGNTLEHASDNLPQAHLRLYAASHNGAPAPKRAEALLKRQRATVVIPTYLHIV